MAKFELEVRSANMEYFPGFKQLGVLEIDPNAECFVQQSDYDRSDINLIVERYIKTGMLEVAQQRQGQYGDFSNVTDYASALNQLNDAQDAFMSLPATIRKRFDNDPGVFLDFVGNPANERELFEMGLLKEGYEPPSEPVKPASGQAGEASAKA